MVFIFLMESCARFLPTFRFWRNEIHKSFLDISPKAGLPNKQQSIQDMEQTEYITLGKNSSEFSETFKLIYLLYCQCQSTIWMLQNFHQSRLQEIVSFTFEFSVHIANIANVLWLYYNTQQKSHTTNIFKKFLSMYKSGT